MAVLKVEIKDPHTLKLKEDGKVGDTIDLKSLHTVDETFILEAINQQKDSVYERRLADEKKLFEANLNEQLTKQASSFKEAQLIIENEKRTLAAKLTEALEQAKQNEKHLTEQLRLEFELERQKYEQQLASLKAETTGQLTTKYNEQLHLKDQKIQSLESLQQNMKLQHELNIQSAVKKLETELNERQKEVELLTRERTTRNIKKIGEDLENWCNEQFKAVSLFGFKTSTWEKDNIVIRADGALKGTKGDYIFKVFNNSKHEFLLTSAMVEMKSEQLESENKKKNADHYKKLDDDRNKKGLEYAILVSELEYNVESDAPIFQVAEYDKMYVVRPNFFITLLGIIESIGLKYADIITEEETKKIDFKASLELLDDFERFKEDILNNSFRYMENQMAEIRKQAATIKLSAEKIEKSIDVIIDSHLLAVRRKIENFSITKISKHIEKINS